MNTNKMEQIEDIFADMTDTEISKLLCEYEKKHPDKSILYHVYCDYVKQDVCVHLEAAIEYEEDDNPNSEVIQQYNKATQSDINRWANNTAINLKDIYFDDATTYVDQSLHNELDIRENNFVNYLS